ncbi:MAG TPA: dienelactone hydrolase family protein [Bradyrhizobium sp.]|uniref:dienelactone hydrolase family protein n=1 Tax=Bradyrhizobium sp. TaxID=376 RepID=UPI002D08CD32|nr:dienelactone hydrolase family protein [Bradyrhizobium sp.]HTB03535.1 dienelactone hydrolase family protein [Bradyrhizobium sp.]
MSATFLRAAIAALALSALASVAAAEETVNFVSLDGHTNLTAHLSRPEGDAPRPALVMMHGCSGLLDGRGRIFAIYRAWARALVVQGYVALVVDSATPRGFGQTCSAGPDRITMSRERPRDAYAALQFLQAQPFVRGDRIGLMGWSQGGGIVLLSISDKSAARPQNLAQDFKAAVAFYPGACSERLQSKPFTSVEREGWTTQIPLLALMGEADTWTLFPPCEAFLAAAKARGNPIELKSYPSAVHAFDAPNLSRRELPQYRTGDGPIPVEATDRDARLNAFVRVLEFLKSRLESN